MQAPFILQITLTLSALLVCACGDSPPVEEPAGATEESRSEDPAETWDDAPTARRQTHEELRLSHETPRHSSDGAGRAWIEWPGGEPPCSFRRRPGRQWPQYR